MEYSSEKIAPRGERKGKEKKKRSGERGQNKGGLPKTKAARKNDKEKWMKTKSWGSALKERVYGHALLSSFIHLIQITAYGDQTGCAVLYIFYDAVQRK